MGKPTGFKEFSREVEPYRPSKERLLDFKEIYTDHKEDGLKTQASRCMDCNMDTFELENVEINEDIMELKKLIEKHLEYTGSEIAKSILSNWKQELGFFRKVMPTDYKRVLTEMNLKRKKVV